MLDTLPALLAAKAKLAAVLTAGLVLGGGSVALHSVSSETPEPAPAVTAPVTAEPVETEAPEPVETEAPEPKETEAPKPAVVPVVPPVVVPPAVVSPVVVPPVVVPPAVVPAPKNHGECVSEAAHNHDGEAADGDEHGDRVSTVAKSDCGKAPKPAVKPVPKPAHTADSNEQEHSGSSAGSTDHRGGSGDRHGSGGSDH
ncbi:MAG: hypothetical protein M3Z02_05425 [Actinomycetota bacterium]|nr:hypothetical protein [Actinomycetota bacterium]